MRWFVAALFFLYGCPEVPNKDFHKQGVSKSTWLEVDPPAIMPDGTRCYIWYGRGSNGETITQTPVCNFP